MTKLHRRRWLVGAGALAGAAWLGKDAARAQDYPVRPVRIIVPYPPGGGTDVFARLLAAKIEAEFGQPLVVDNRAGGASVVGTRAVADATPDGYVIGMVDSAFTINPSLFKDLPYDTRTAFVPISLLTRTQLVLCVTSSSPFKTTQELVAYAKSNPGKLTFASAGNGSPPHLGGEQFRQAAGIEMVTVPYRGGAPALTGLLSGAVDFTVSTVPTIPAANSIGHGERTGRHSRPHAAIARYSQHGRAWLRKRRRDKRDGAGGAGRDAGADRRETPSPLSGRGQRSGIPGRSDPTRLSADRHHNRRISRSYRPRDRQMGQGYCRRKREAGVSGRPTARA